MLLVSSLVVVLTGPSLDNNNVVLTLMSKLITVQALALHWTFLTLKMTLEWFHTVHILGQDWFHTKEATSWCNIIGQHFVTPE